MTFTQADHDKAVELYQRFGKAEWWPAHTHWNSQDGAWQFHIDGRPWWDGNFLRTHHAVAAIFAAMVERLDALSLRAAAQFCDITGIPTPLLKWALEVNGRTFAARTRFLALAAAVEALP